MSVRAATRHPAPHSALRRLVARHPVAAFVLMVYAVNCAVALVPLLTRRDILPFGLAPYDALGHIFGVALPAFIVVAAMNGQAGVLDLARRCLRWRVGRPALLVPHGSDVEWPRVAGAGLRTLVVAEGRIG